MEKELKRLFITVLFIFAAVVSVFILAKSAASVETHAADIASLDEKIETVLKLTASSTIASAGISAIPGDTATPIAAKLADFTEYFMLTLCVLYAEKYLLTILGAASFKVMVPLACVCFAAGMYRGTRVLHKLGLKVAILALAFYFTIPLSIKVSDMIFDMYSDSFENTISAAEEFSDDTADFANESEGLLAGVKNPFVETASSLSKRAARILNRFVESLAVMIVTSCIIPVLVLIFFLWLTRLLTGIEINVQSRYTPDGWKRNIG